MKIGSIVSATAILILICELGSMEPHHSFLNATPSNQEQETRKGSKAARLSGSGAARKTYGPNWQTLSERPLPRWYHNAKLGIMLHWGVYSVPAFGTEWFWMRWRNGEMEFINFMKHNYPNGYTYGDFANNFKAMFFNATQWTDILSSAGAKYVIVTSKYHDGFTLWPSNQSGHWNSVETGPHINILRELSDAIRSKSKLKFGVYYSLYEWFNSLYLADKKKSFATKRYTTLKVHPELMSLVEEFQPEVLWVDGDWEAPEKYWMAQDFLAWLYTDSPVRKTVVINDRWGRDVRCKYGDVINCENHYHPTKLPTHKWENYIALDRESLGYRSQMPISDIYTTEEIIMELVTTVAYGGNLVINIGPTKDGIIAPIFEERLLNIGKWLKVNGNSIYNTSPWIHQKDPKEENVWYTCFTSKYDGNHPIKIPNDLDVEILYAIFLQWPDDNLLNLAALHGLMDMNTNVTMLGYGELTWFHTDFGPLIQLPSSVVLSLSAWTLEITNFRKIRNVKLFVN